jgi:hypothetical protein
MGVMTALHVLTLLAVLPAALLFFLGGTVLSASDWGTAMTDSTAADTTPPAAR